MSSPIPGIPPIEETRHSRESLLDALRNKQELPRVEIAVATLYADTIEPDILAVLDRARRENALDLPSDRLLFRGIHILGGRRFPAAYRPLVAFLRGPQDRVEELLGDAITENLSQILAGLFDGDEQPLRDLILDAKVDRFVCEAALKALAFLVIDRRADRAAFESFLLRFDVERLTTDDDDVMWHGWMSAVALLGLTTLETRVRAAFADGRIPPYCCGEGDFDALLKAAIERPDDRTRLDVEAMGYIEDVLVALEKFGPVTDDLGAGGEAVDGNWLDRHATGLPARNPYRDIGRNDPCPCGSGRKFKKCCFREAGSLN